jgi:hypothetical protein
MNDQPKTTPSSATRAEEARDAEVKAGADKVDGGATAADGAKVSEDVAAHEKEMDELGANQKGEGRLP